MGLSIHYSGSFNPAASLQEMIDEVKAIAKVCKWQYTIYETTFPEQNESRNTMIKYMGFVLLQRNVSLFRLSFFQTER